jgi:hypothetical protein
MNRQYLDPKQPLDIEPAADRNVERMTDCCLDIRPKSSYIFGRGRGGGAWWMIWMGMMLIVLGAFTSFMDGNIRTGIPAFLGICAIAVSVFGLSLLWPIHIWKTHLPLRFNRQTRKVYFHWKGKTYMENWDVIRAYLKVQFLLTATGAPLNDPHINLEFHNEDGSVFTVFLMGVERTDLTTEQRAKAFWEFIRRFMEDGAENLPTPDQSHEFKDDAMKEIWEMYKLFPLWEKNVSFLTKVFGIFLVLPISAIWSAISYPTEILYYYLEKHIKTNPFPPEMESACRCDEAIKVWYPKQATDEAA